MPKSTLTTKYQTTVPKEVREKLALAPGDELRWEIREGTVQVSPAEPAFLALRGSIRVGPGSTVEDVRRARAMRGRELV
jgi:AbrB family looped-hinge helix DNA binding protein